MLTPIDPKSLYVIHKDKERELERNIERMRAARERGPASNSAFEQKQAWYLQVVQSLKARLAKRPSRLPETL